MTDPKASLGQVRERIDSIDRQIQELISERANWAQEVAKVKGEGLSAIDYYRPEREAHVLRMVVDRNGGPLSDAEMVRLFREIMSSCLAQEDPLKIATPRRACRWAASRKSSRKSPRAMPISVWYRWRIPGRA
jgi:chorismate mutase/prephenate dehydratase